MKFNLEDYEPVEDRIKRFYKDHKDGRIITFLRSEPNNEEYAVFEAQIFIGEEMKSTGWAQEIRDVELKKTRDGKTYESVNYSAWLENAETSAIGRALANFNYCGSRPRPSREEMNKVKRKPPPEKAEKIAEERWGKTELTKEEYALADTRHTELVELLKTPGLNGKQVVALLKASDMPEHRYDVAWLERAITRTMQEIEKQEAVLAANMQGELLQGSEEEKDE